MYVRVYIYRNHVNKASLVWVSYPILTALQTLFYGETGECDKGLGVTKVFADVVCRPECSWHVRGGRFPLMLMLDNLPCWWFQLLSDWHNRW